MSGLALLGLAGLALVDSTSIGTLVLPLLLLLAPRVHVGRFLVYLGTVAAFYAVVGLALVAGAGWLVDVGSGLGEIRVLRQAELGLGVALLAVGVLGDPRRWFRRSRATPPDPADEPRRAAQWGDRLLGPEAGYGAVVGVGLVAALIEVGSMLPFLAAVGIITAADLPTLGWIGVVLGYTLVMVLPALALLGVRLLLGGRVEQPLAQMSDWLTRQAGRAGWWALAIIGVVLISDAQSALG